MPRFTSIFFKIVLKLSYFSKNAKFSSAEGSNPKPPASSGWGLPSQTHISLRQLGSPPSDPKHTAPPIANSWLRAYLQHGVLLQILLSFTLIFHAWSIMIGGNHGMLNLKNLCCFITFQFSLLCVYIHNQQKLCL